MSRKGSAYEPKGKLLMAEDELFNYVMGQIRVGREYERYVADQLIVAGVPAVVGQEGVTETRTEQEWREFKDERDILVAGRWRLEVKSRTFSFTGVADHPFDSTIVSTVRSWENKAEKPVAVAIVSQPTRAIVVVPASTRMYWEKRERPDRKRGYAVLNYECPVELLKPWDDLVSWFKDRLDEMRER